MRALLQRVSRAEVRVAEEVVGSIGCGLLVFLGVEVGDTDEDQHWLVNKVAGQRLFSDESGRMNRSVAESGGSFLVVSQFTLLATTCKGMRPGFSRSEQPEIAERRYGEFCEALAAHSGCAVARGRFAAHMAVELINDGPVTVMIDSRLRE